MRRSAWMFLVLVSLGLWAGLFAQVTYRSTSSGEPNGNVLIAWPGWSVQQDLEAASGAVGTYRIWVSSDPAGFKDVTLNASLIDATTREVLRQALLTVSRRYIPAAHTVTFPRYVVPEGQRLMLQLGVPESEERHVIYRLASPDPARANIMLNGVPDSGDGPLAIAHMRTGSGLRAALNGDTASQFVLVLAIVAGTLAVPAHPRIARKLGQAANGARHCFGRLRRCVGRAVRADSGHLTQRPPSRFNRFLKSSWYPWPAAAVPILHYLATNPLHFAVSEAILPLAIVLATVTVLVVGLRLGLKDWHRAAAATTAIIVVFFGYGHVAGAIDRRIDDRLLLSLAVMLPVAIAVLIGRRGSRVAPLAPFLNIAAAVLLLFPLTSLLVVAVTASSHMHNQGQHNVKSLATHLLPAGVPEVTGHRPHIYYIILDTYARHDALLDLYNYDNRDFIRQLEDRGFYVVAKATSNYDSSIPSIASSLNMSYLNAIGSRTPTSQADLIKAAQSHALGSILQSIGYTYIHLASGYIATNTSPLADHVVTFTPSGPLNLLQPAADQSQRRSSVFQHSLELSSEGLQRPQH